MGNDITAKNLYIQLYSIHGLIRGHDLELGRDADTGGQTKYVVELANSLSEDPRVEKVELVTRLIKDKNVSPDYSQHIEKINDKFSIVRIKCGGKKYIRKELLWQHLEEFVDKSIKHIKSAGRLPDIIHSHYADAGYVCSELTKFFGIPFIHTGHSLGKEKLRKLLEDGMTIEDVEKKFKISHRINVEEEVVYFADLIIASTRQEIQKQYAGYANTNVEKFRVIPPGVDLEKFFPYNNKEQAQEEAVKLRAIITEKLLRFFVDAKKPLILSISRAAKKKNISSLITAYGEDKELQRKANLAIFAGIRKDIQTMEENEKEVLTEILLLMDKYDLYGKLAIPKRHDSEHEVPELYRIAAETGGVFVNPAYTEPFGLTLIEAAGTGVPVVSTDDGGPRDIIANCKNGLLVNVSEPKNIAAAINKILDDKILWNEFSENGIKNVKKYYTWKAHMDSYLNEINNLRSQGRIKVNTFEQIGKKLFNMKKLIITDIDNTLLGDEKALEEFILLLSSNSGKTGFAVATGRSIDSAVDVLNEHAVPQPDVIISSVGSEIFYNHNGQLVYSKGWDNHISHLWKRETIAEILKEFDFLDYQEKEAQRKYKVSYYMQGGEESLQKVKEALMKNKLKINLIYSHGELLDILPYRASKGKAIRYLSFRQNIPYKNILIAGDSGNDEEMLKGELLGVVVANYSPELEPLKGSKGIYFAERSYAGGIIDGINYYDFLNDGRD
ncbi:MAG: HAD-IIB family hydrolase [Ignavibacteriaceae bacterium]